MENDPTSYRVAAVQMEPKLGRLDANLEQILNWLEPAAMAGAKLVVFPECALSGYGFSSREEGLAHAVSLDSAQVRKVVAACARHQCFCVFGLLERDGDRLFNACVLAGPDGVVGSYRKVHLPFLGIDMFVDPGDRPFAVHDAGGSRSACTSVMTAGFPRRPASYAPGRRSAGLADELADAFGVRRRAHDPDARHGKHGLCDGRQPGGRGERVSIHRRQLDRRPGGRVLARAGSEAEEVLQADINPTLARRKHLVRVPGRHEIDRIADRRPRFYEALVAPNGRD